MIDPQEACDSRSGRWRFIILSRLVTWVCLSGSRNQIEIEADPRHREILLAEMNLYGANVKSVTTPAMKMQEWSPQMLTMLDKGSASTFNSATMRTSFMSINRMEVPQATKKVAWFMAEPNGERRGGLLHVTYFQHIRTDLMISFSRWFRAQNSTCIYHKSINTANIKIFKD